MINKAIVDYVFKTKSYSLGNLNTKDIEASISSKISGSTEKELYSLGNLDLQEYIVGKQLEGFNTLQDKLTAALPTLEDTVRRRGAELQDLITQCKSSVNSAILAEKRLIGESYTAILPLTAQYANIENTTATITDGVIFGTSTAQVVVDGLNIDAIYLVGEDFTDLKVLADTFPLYLELGANVMKSYNQVRVTVPAIVNNGVFSLTFDQPQVISILNASNLEILPKQVVKNISIPVSKSSSNFKIRFHSNQKKSVKILSAKYSDKIYTESCTFETQPIAIGQDLSAITIETCDNYTDPNVDMNYYISINGGAYNSFRPSGKTKLISTSMPQSIIKTDQYISNDIVPINYSDLYLGSYRYYPVDLVPQYAKLIMLSKLLGTDTYSANSYNSSEKLLVHLFNVKDSVLKINIGQSVVLDGKYIQYSDYNGNVLIKAGYHTLEMDKVLWKEPVDLLEASITQVHPTYLITVDRVTGEEVEVSYTFDTAQAATNSIYLQLLSAGYSIFLNKENIFRKLDDSYVEYFYRNTNETIYLLNYNQTKTVNTVQIKATFMSKDKVTCPYISKIIIRGL